MQILLLTPALPYPPHQGGALRNFGILRGLHDAGHTITLLSFHDAPLAAPVPGTPLPAVLRAHRDRCAADRARRSTACAICCSRAARSGAAAGIARLPRAPARPCSSRHRFDLIQFEGLEMAIYLPLVRQLQPDAKLIYDAHNAEYALQQVIAEVESGSRSRLPAALYSRDSGAAHRPLRARDLRASRRRDRRLAGRRRRAAPVPPRSAGLRARQRHLHRRLRRAQSRASNSAARCWSSPARWTTARTSTRCSGSPSAILPRIRAECPDARLYIVGQKPHASLQTLREDDHVEVTGWVAQVQPFLHAAQVYVAPLRMGSGTRLKILEAMAAGCAVVATSAAVAGLDDEARDALVIADSEADFCRRRDRPARTTPKQRQTLGRAGAAGRAQILRLVGADPLPARHLPGYWTWIEKRSSCATAAWRKPFMPCRSSIACAGRAASRRRDPDPAAAQSQRPDSAAAPRPSRRRAADHPGDPRPARRPPRRRNSRAGRSLVGERAGELQRTRRDPDAALPRLQPRRAKLSWRSPYQLVARIRRGRLRRIGYDTAVIFRPDHWWGALLAHLAGIPRRIGYDLPDVAPFLTDAHRAPAPARRPAKRAPGRAADRSAPARTTCALQFPGR